MKFIHIADLHFGKSLYGYSLIDQGDQKYWVDKFLELVDNEKPDAVLIAGDIYDRSVPSKEAVELLDYFITSLANRDVTVLAISGNHDSGKRLSFGAELFQDKNVYIVGDIKSKIKKVTINDEYGPVNFYLLPYFFPALVEVALGDESIKTYNEAIKTLLANSDIDYNERNVIVSHQTVINNGEKLSFGGSEGSIGAVGEIDVSAYQGFDYVALGHIHAAQKVKEDNIRYAGSPLCYHFNETKRPLKGPVIVNLKEKGELDYHIAEIAPLHPLREVKGELKDILIEESSNNKTNEYIRIVITDELVPQTARDSLFTLFEAKNSMICEIAHEVTRESSTINNICERSDTKTISELFNDFYRSRNGDEFPDEKDQELINMVEQQVMHVDDDEKVDVPNKNDIQKIIDFIMKQEEET